METRAPADDKNQIVWILTTYWRNVHHTADYNGDPLELNSPTRVVYMLYSGIMSKIKNHPVQGIASDIIIAQISVDKDFNILYSGLLFVQKFMLKNSKQDKKKTTLNG